MDTKEINLYKTMDLDDMSAAVIKTKLMLAMDIEEATFTTDIRGFFYLQRNEGIVPIQPRTLKDLDEYYKLKDKPDWKSACGKACGTFMANANRNFKPEFDDFFPLVTPLSPTDTSKNPTDKSMDTPDTSMSPVRIEPHLGYNGFDYIECVFQIELLLFAGATSRAIVRDARIILRVKAVDFSVWGIDYEWRPISRQSKQATPAADVSLGTLYGEGSIQLFYDLDLTVDYLLPYFIGVSTSYTGPVATWNEDSARIFGSGTATAIATALYEQEALEELSEFARTLISSLDLIEEVVALTSDQRSVLDDCATAFQLAQSYHLRGEMSASGEWEQVGTEFNAALLLEAREDEDNSAATFTLQRLPGTQFQLRVENDYTAGFVRVAFDFAVDKTSLITKALEFEAYREEDIAGVGLDLTKLESDTLVLIRLMDEDRQIYDVLALEDLSAEERAELESLADNETLFATTVGTLRDTMDEIGVPQVSLDDGIRMGIWRSGLSTPKLDRDIHASQLFEKPLGIKNAGTLLEYLYGVKNLAQIDLNTLGLKYKGADGVLRKFREAGEWDYYDRVTASPVQITHSTSEVYFSMTGSRKKGRKLWYDKKLLRLIRADPSRHVLFDSYSEVLYKTLVSPSLSSAAARDLAMLNGIMTINAEDMRDYVDGDGAWKTVYEQRTWNTKAWIDLQLRTTAVQISTANGMLTFSSSQELNDAVGSGVITSAACDDAFKTVCKRIRQRIRPNPDGLNAANFQRMVDAQDLSSAARITGWTAHLDPEQTLLYRVGFTKAYLHAAPSRVAWGGTLNAAIPLGAELVAEGDADLDITTIGGDFAAGVLDEASSTGTEFGVRRILSPYKLSSTSVKLGAGSLGSGVGGAVFEFATMEAEEWESGLQYSTKEEATRIGAAALGGFVAVPASMAATAGAAAVLGISATGAGAVLVGVAAAVLVASIVAGVAEPAFREIWEYVYPREELIIGPSHLLEYGYFQVVADYFTEADQIWVTRTGRYKSVIDPLDGTSRIYAEVTKSKEIEGRECEVAKPFFESQPTYFYWPVDQLSPTSDIFLINRVLCGEEPGFFDSLFS